MKESDSCPAGTQDGTCNPALRRTAHDLRNALNIIRNASYLLRRKLTADGSPHLDLVDMIDDSTKIAEGIATSLMDQAVNPAGGSQQTPPAR